MDKDILIHQMSQGNKKIVVPTKIPKYNFVNKLEKMDSLTSGVYIVTENGMSTGKYLGILIV